MGLNKRWTDDEINFLFEYYPNLGVNKTTEKHNELFEIQRTKIAITHKTRELKIYTEDNFSAKRVPEYTVRKAGGTTRIKIGTKWYSYAKYVYEQAYGPVPKNHYIFFIDGNNDNFDPKNLTAIPNWYRGVLLKRKWYSQNKNLNNTALTYCDLVGLINDREIRKE